MCEGGWGCEVPGGEFKDVSVARSNSIVSGQMDGLRDERRRRSLDAMHVEWTPTKASRAGQSGEERGRIWLAELTYA